MVVVPKFTFAASPAFPGVFLAALLMRLTENGTANADETIPIEIYLAPFIFSAGTPITAE
uniref:Uncharacterized protein n=1 Tax=viral metagenome TaxID=1070528 RepID=A0A6M3J9L8_9ZZZZ